MIAQSFISVLWFAIIFDSDYLYSSVLVSQTLVAIIFFIEIFSILFFKYSLFNFSHLYTTLADWLISIFYHILVAGVALFILLKKRIFIKDAWFFSVCSFLFVSFVIYFGYYTNYITYTDFFINCAGYCPDFGIITPFVSFFYSLLPIPNFIINTILVGIIFYFLTFFYSWLLNRTKRISKKKAIKKNEIYNTNKKISKRK